MDFRIGGKTWFNYLNCQQNSSNPGLLDFYSPNPSRSDIVIALERANSRKYRLFDNYLAFQNELNLTNPMLRNFHEVILKGKHLKLYFDIEVHNADYLGFDQNKFFDDTISNLIVIFKSFDIDLNLERDIFWLTSHKQGKYSYHLIIDNYYFFSLNEINHIIDKFKLMTVFSSYFDWGVYSKNHLLRTCYGTKYGENRIFEPLLNWNFRNQVIDYKYPSYKNKMVLDFQASLITNTGHCRFVNFICKEKIKTYPEISINTELDKIIKEYIDSLDGIKFKRREKNHIYLERIRESYCELCEREHYNENPFIYLKKDLEGNIGVYYTCRRNENKVLIHQELVQQEEGKINIRLSSEFEDLKNCIPKVVHKENKRVIV